MENQIKPQLKPKRNFTDGYKKISQQFLCNQYSKLCRNLFSTQKSSIQITRTSSTLTYTNTRIVCSKKLQMKKIIKPRRHEFITKSRSIQINVSNLDVDIQDSSGQKQEDGKELIDQLIKQALIILQIKFEQWTTDWEKYTDDKKKLLFALKVIEIQYLKIKSEITDIMDNKRFKQFRDILDIDIKVPPPEEYVAAVLEQFPQIYNFNLDCIASEGISQMKALQLQTLPYLIELEQELSKRKKNKKKNKKKKKKMNGQMSQNVNDPQSQNKQQNKEQGKTNNQIIKTEDDVKFQQIFQFLKNFNIKEEDEKKMQEIKVYDNWIQKMNKKNLQWKNKKEK